MSTPKKITAGLFAAIKRLQADGAKQKEVEEYFNISSSTVSRVYRSDSFEEYLDETAARASAIRAGYAKKDNPPPEPQEVIHRHEQSGTIIANHYMAEQLAAQTKYLELISNKLAYIVEELAGVPAKKEM